MYCFQPIENKFVPVQISLFVKCKKHLKTSLNKSILFQTINKL